MANVRANEKDINTKNYYIAIQISKLISSNYKQLTMDINEELLDSLDKLNIVMQNCPLNLFPVLGNNLVETNFNIITVNVMKKFLQPTTKNILFNRVFVSLLNVNWNCTDSSEKYCKYLLNTDGFKDSITKIFFETPYNMENMQIVTSGMSIINNIIRRQTLRNTFENKLIQKLMEIFNDRITTRDFKIISCAMIFYLSSDKEVKQYFSLVDDIKNDIITILDATSNNNNLHAEGFKLIELLEMLIIFCKSDNIKNFVGKNNTLFTTLLRVLSQDRHAENIINFARFIYSDEKFVEFQNLFIRKYGHSNKKIIELLQEQ